MAQKRIGVKPDPMLRRRSILIQQLEADLTDADLKKCRQTLHTGLCRAVEQGVATAEISPQWMLNTAAIPERDGVLLTRATAIGVVMTIREKGAEHAVVHVKQGHVLMEGHLDA